MKVVNYDNFVCCLEPAEMNTSVLDVVEVKSAELFEI